MGARGAELSVLQVGAGTIGRVHGDAWARLQAERGGVRLLGIVDPDAEGARLAAQLQVKYFATWDDVPLAAVDVVDVASPTPTHRWYVEAAAAAGKHVFCEKPLALTLEDVDAMAKAAEQAGVHLAVGHVVRFFPAYRRAHDLIASGRMGAVVMARLYRGGAFPRGRHNWYADRAQSGGPLLDLSLHDFDFLLWTFGPPVSVFAQEAGAGDPPLMYAAATVRFPSGLLAHVMGSWAGTQFSTRFEFAGPEGLLMHDSRQDQPLLFTRRAGVEAVPAVAVPSAAEAANPWMRQLAAMVAAVAEDRPFDVGVAEARAAIQLARAAVESAATGSVVPWAVGA